MRDFCAFSCCKIHAFILKLYGVQNYLEMKKVPAKEDTGGMSCSDTIGKGQIRYVIKKDTFDNDQRSDSRGQ